MEIFAYSVAGLGRKTNEDRYLIKRNGQAAVLIAVADGLGGEAAGDYAADIMRETLARSARNFKGNEHQLSDLIKKVDRFLREKAEEDDSLWGMGTTTTCVCLYNSTVHWSHVGDSRFYLFRNQKLKQITRDQTFARFLVEEGRITETEARLHDARHNLEQCVGCGDCEPDLGNFRIEPGDIFLLTTDGIHGFVPNEKISLALNAKTDPETKVMAIAQAARDAGGSDDMTVLIAQVED